MEKIWNKIYKYYDINEYHICRTLDCDGGKWALYKKYEGWLTDNSKPIMTSDEYSDQDLLKFLKKHRTIDMGVVFNKISMCVCQFNLILCLLNILFFHNKELSKFCMYSISYLLLIAVIMTIIYCKKMKIDMSNSSIEFKTRFSKYINKGEDNENE